MVPAAVSAACGAVSGPQVYPYSIDAFNARVIVDPAFAPQRPRQQRRPPPRILRGEFAQPCAQRRIVAAWLRHVAHRRAQDGVCIGSAHHARIW